MGDVPQLHLEAQLQYQILRSDIKAATDMAMLQRVALQVVDMMELQRRTALALMKRPASSQHLRPRPHHPAPARDGDAAADPPLAA